jgi:hypothetical protein
MSRSSAVLKALRVRAVLVPFRRPFIAGIGQQVAKSNCCGFFRPENSKESVILEPAKPMFG